MQVNQLSYRHHETAPYFFRDLNFELEPNKIHALHGSNGVGKTVLLNLLSNNSPEKSISSGEVLGIENAVLVNQRFDQMIADQFTFEDNLKFACMGSCPNPFTQLKPPRFYPEFLERFNIDLAQPVKSLSGGQRQILALLMVLQKKCSVLLLDEPTATLDEHNSKIIFEFLLTLASQGVTILVVCHDSRLLFRYANGQHLSMESDEKGERRICIQSR